MKSEAVITPKNFRTTPNNLQQMHLKQLEKNRLKKQQKQLVILLIVKLLTKLQKFREFHHRIVQRPLRMKLKI